MFSSMKILTWRLHLYRNVSAPLPALHAPASLHPFTEYQIPMNIILAAAQK